MAEALTTAPAIQATQPALVSPGGEKNLLAEKKISPTRMQSSGVMIFKWCSLRHLSLFCAHEALI